MKYSSLYLKPGPRIWGRTIENETKREAYGNYQPGHEEEVSSHRQKEEQINRQEPANVGQGVTVSSLFGVYTPGATSNCRERKFFKVGDNRGTMASEGSKKLMRGADGAQTATQTWT